MDERLARVIELRYFAGCSLEEVAELAACSLATVKRDWTYARAWLFERMQSAGKGQKAERSTGAR
jgi:DNA-directed RNA polymerase specialized sigma24 family protein